MDDEFLRGLYKELGCGPDAMRGNPQAYGLQRKVEKIHEYCLKHQYSCKSQKQLLNMVRQEWTAGLGPVASWLMWMAIQSLAKWVVLRFWKHYS